MNKQQRDYAIDRVRRIANSKTIKCECESPSINGHIRRAVAAGTAKVKPAKEIIAIFEKKIMESDGYRSCETTMDNLFEAPQSFKDAQAELKAEQKKHEDENNVTLAYGQALVDRIELGEFEDGKEPIRLMEAYAPKQPAAKKKQ